MRRCRWHVAFDRGRVSLRLRWKIYGTMDYGLGAGLIFDFDEFRMKRKLVISAVSEFSLKSPYKLRTQSQSFFQPMRLTHSINLLPRLCHAGPHLCRWYTCSVVEHEILRENVHIVGLSCIIFAAQEIIYEGFDVFVLGWRLVRG